MVPIEVFRCGLASDGTPIEAFARIVDPAGSFLHLHAGMHGDEPEGRDVALALFDEIKRGLLNPGSNFVVIPQINPTGLVSGTRGNSRGVDINRNFPTTTWNSEHSAERYFPGTGAASESETVAVIAAMDRFRPHAIVTLHTWVPQVNFDGDDRAARLATFLAERNNYKVTPYIGYPTPGSFGTYSAIERGIPTVTLEMPEKSGIGLCMKENGTALRDVISWGARV